MRSTVGQQKNTIFGAIASGYAVGIAPLIAYNYGAKDTDALKLNI